jgi:hypothetical protein
MPADEGLGQPDFLDEVGDRRVAARESADDTQPVDVGERLVDDPQLAQLVGLIDDRGQRGTDPGGGRAQGKPPAPSRP